MTDNRVDTADDRPWNAMNSGVIREAIEPSHLGRAEISPTGRFMAGTHESFTLTYTAGTFGIDDSGSIRVCFRFASDQGSPQLDDPEAANYCTVEASNGALLQVRWDPKGNVRPWDRTLWIKVVKGFLSEGDSIVVRFGVSDHGGPGMRLQTFCEDTFEFRVLVDPIATFNFQPLSVQPTISIVPGEPERFVAVLPTRRRPGEPFSLHIKGEDRWGNPSDRCSVALLLQATGPIKGLPERVSLRPGEHSLTLPELVVEGTARVSVTVNDESGTVLCRTNPLVVEDTELIHFWADLHGQSQETIGTGSAEDYFAFARDCAWVDACGHQGNDFQISAEFWDELNRITARFDVPGKFVALPGYEWSGNTSLGGDRNVYFPEENRTIRRSSHALIEHGAARDTDCTTANELFDAFAREAEFDVVCYAHCGGRYADIGLAHDGRFERSVEVHSSWGTFEWLLHDAFRLDYRVGIVANSDGHKGRPGASYPGSGKFGAIGGLTCFHADTLSRAALLDSMRKRRHYATTGGDAGRMMIDLRVRFGGQATVFHDDPALGQADSVLAVEAMMGDIVHLPAGEAELSVRIETSSPIVRVDVFNGLELVETVRPHAAHELGNRLRLHWEGAEYRGRFREVVWDGQAIVTGNTIRRAIPINFLNPDKTVERVGTDRVSWASLTTGNFAGADIYMDEEKVGVLSVTTPLVSFELPVADIGLEDTVFDASGELPRFFKVYRLPEQCNCRSLSFSRSLTLDPTKDNPVYIRVEQEDGTRAWTSPVYLFR